MQAMGTKSREVIWGGQIMGAKISARSGREAAQKVAREAAVADDRECLNGGLGRLEVECNRCKTRASLPLDAIRRPRDTPIWKLEAALKCRSCRKGRYAPPVIKLTATQDHAVSVGASGRRAMRSWPVQIPQSLAVWTAKHRKSGARFAYWANPIG
jgi:hypothetical protein